MYEEVYKELTASCLYIFALCIHLIKIRMIVKNRFCRILDFTAPANDIVNKIRAFSPVPGAEAKLPSGKVKITSAKLLSEAPTGEAGTVAALSAKGAGLLVINAVDAKIQIEKLIPEGKKEMTAGDFIRGRRIAESFLSPS